VQKKRVSKVGEGGGALLQKRDPAIALNFSSFLWERMEKTPPHSATRKRILGDDNTSVLASRRNKGEGSSDTPPYFFAAGERTSLPSIQGGKVEAKRKG